MLKKEGSLWLNLGDSYWGGKGQSGQAWSTEHTDRDTLQKPYHQISGMEETRPSDGRHSVIKPKDLVGIPWAVAFALRADGWWLRQDIIWHKPNPMPESVTDRCTKAHEYIFLLTKSAKYYYDNEAVKEEQSSNGNGGFTNKTTLKTVLLDVSHKPSLVNAKNDGFRNRRSVWTIPTAPYKEAHFATFPEDLIIPMIKAGCPEGGIVLDPFSGAGTTCLVAKKLFRNYIGIELNPEYVAMSERRIEGQCGGLF